MAELIVRRAVDSEKEAIRQVLHEYLRELATITGEVIGDEIQYPYLDLYWSEDSRYPFVAHDAQGIAGFALVREVDTHYEIAEFYIRPDLRQRGYGEALARAAMNDFPGPWEIAYADSNITAERFWNRIASQATSPVVLIQKSI